MIRTLACAALLLTASTAVAQTPKVLFHLSYNGIGVGNPAILPGEDLVLSITAESGPTYDFLYEVPPHPGHFSPGVHTFFTPAEPNGVDFTALETALIGDRGQGILWGVPGAQASKEFIIVPDGWVNEITLTDIRASAYQRSTTEWGYVSITFQGTVSVTAPEPSTGLLLLCGCVHLASFRRRSAELAC